MKINPVQDLRLNDAKYKFDLTICGKGGNINMIEASAHETKEEELEEAFKMASAEITKLEDFQKKMVVKF